MARVFSFLTISIAFFTFIGCSPKTLPTAETIYVGTGESGTIILNSTGYYKGDFDKTTYVSEKQAFETLLFRGVPGSQVPDPLLGLNEKEIKDKHQKYFQEFFDNKRYRSFVMSSEVLDTSIKKGFKIVKIRIKINISSLTKDLESNGLKRGFGL